MTRPPRVSIILPVYNSAPFLAEGLDSVLSQTCQDFEILMIDDGSSDRSARIAEIYLRLHPGRVQLYTHRNRSHRGVSASRNLGLKRSRGRYLAFLDADDLWNKHKLAIQADLMDQHAGVGMTFCHYRVRSPLGPAVLECPPPLPPDLLDRPVSLWNRLVQDNFVATSTVMLRRDVLNTVGGFPQDIRTEAEDWHLWLNISTRHPLYFISRPMVTIRQHGRNTSSHSYQQGLMFWDQFRFMTSLKRIWSQRHDSKELSNTLRKKLLDRTWMLAMESENVAAHWRGAVGLLRYGIPTCLKRKSWAAWIGLLQKLFP